MPEITYAMLKAIIVKEEINGMMINLEFKTEDMAQPMMTVATVMPDQEEIMKNVAKSAAKSAVINSAVSGAASMLGLGSVGSKIGSKIAGATAGDPMDMLKTEITPEKKAKAIETAFAPIQQFFSYDEANKKWSSRQP